MNHRIRTLAAAALLLMAGAGRAAAAQVEDTELATINGGYEPLLGTGAKVNALVFFRSDQDRSFDALRQLAGAEREFSSKPVHWVAVISGGASLENVKAATAATGAQMPVVVDMGDRIFRALGVAGYPTVIYADGAGRVTAMDLYAGGDLRAMAAGRIRFGLGEIDKAAMERAMAGDAEGMAGPDPAKKAMTNVNMARKLYALGLYAKAVKQAQRALEQAPVPAAYTVIGASYARLGLCPDAKKMLDQSAKLDPGNEEAAAARASCGFK
ncbi:MAG: hypothetical protein QM767_25435 [Anaeromyxobacter sp.]